MQQQRPGLPLRNLSNNLRAMSRVRPILWLSILVALVACNDETTQSVDADVCVSMGPSAEPLPGTQWVGGKRGSPEMYPGRDCVGCHLENDGPEFMFGGTVYPYIERDFVQAGIPSPTGDDCFGLEGVDVRVIGGDGQEFVTTSNAAGNFFVEGKATDLVKPIKVYLSYQPPGATAPLAPEMFTGPSYGGCGRCHAIDAKAYPLPADMLEVSDDEKIQPAGSRIGVGNILKFDAMN